MIRSVARFLCDKTQNAIDMPDRVHQQLTTSFEVDVLVLATRRRTDGTRLGQRSRTFYRPDSARGVQRARSVVRSLGHIADLLYRHITIQQFVARSLSCAASERATKLMRQFNDGGRVACMQRRPSNGLIDI